jgi:hypothetical protein
VGVATLLGLAASVLLSGCLGFVGGRSVAAACKVWDTQGLALHNQLEQADSSAGSDPLAALSEIATTPAQMGDLMTNIGNVAPSDVEPAFQELASAFQQMAQSESSDPLAALVSGMADGAESQGAVNTVNDFLSHNCGIPGQ